MVGGEAKANGKGTGWQESEVNCRRSIAEKTKTAASATSGLTVCALIRSMAQQHGASGLAGSWGADE
jgi:hypothetical protein